MIKQVSWRLLLAASAVLAPVWGWCALPQATVHVGNPAQAAVHVGNPARPAALAAAVAATYEHGARRIIINPGVYNLPATGRPTFELRGWRNATIIAKNVTLIMRVKHAGPCFELDQCRNVTISGATISQTQVTFYQGRVVAAGKGKHGWYCLWRPDRGYPFPAIGAKKFPRGFDVVNGQTRRLRRGSGDIWAATNAAAGKHTFRLGFRFSRQRFYVGDWLVARYGDAAQKVRLDHSRDCTIEGITMMRNGFAPIFENAGGANRIISCRWVLGPSPAGATTPPVVTNQADGFHCVNSYPGPDIEHCVMKGVFLDDCIAIHGEFHRVVGAAGKHITIKDNRDAMLAVGEPIQISSKGGFFAVATVSAIRRDGKTSDITLAKALAVPVGALVTNPLRCGDGYKVIDCRLGDTRSRGMLLKGSDGLVQGNTIRGCGMAGISIGPEYWWREAGYCDHVLVEGNTLLHNGKGGWGGYFAAVYVHGDGAIGNHHIVIRDNRFIGNFSGDVFMQWAGTCVVANNIFTAPRKLAYAGERTRAEVIVRQSHDVVVSKNRVIAPGPGGGDGHVEGSSGAK